MKDAINVGLIGFGNIGTGVVQTLNNNGKLIDGRLSLPLKITRIADIDLKTRRDADYDPAILTDDAVSVVKDPDIDIIIELIGGTGAARDIVEAALKNKKHVVTANKALLAKHGAELLNLAKENGVALLFEAAVGAGIPIIRSMTYAFSANRFKAVRGIMNGTTNYILTKMEREERSFDDVLSEAQELGYAEPDPTFDVEGYDTAHKLAILASLAFRQDIRINDVFVRGITGVQQEDLASAREMGYTVKLLGITKQNDDDSVEVRVHPTLIPENSTLAAVSDAYNAIEVEGDPVGPQLLYGQGAGKGSTSSAILGDVMDIARCIADGTGGPQPVKINVGEKKVTSMSDLETAYYIRMTLKDVPGMLAEVASVFGEEKISIRSVLQRISDPGKFANAIFITHLAREGNIQNALRNLKEKEICKGTPFVLRVEF